MASKSRLLITINTPQGRIQEFMEPAEFQRLKQDKRAFQDFLQRHKIIRVQTEPSQQSDDDGGIAQECIEHTESKKRSVAARVVEPTGRAVEPIERSVEVRERIVESSDRRERCMEPRDRRERCMEQRDRFAESRERCNATRERSMEPIDSFSESTESSYETGRSEESSERPEEISQGASGQWGRAATLMLIEEHSKISKQVEAGRLTKKSMWQLISSHLGEKGYEYTTDQVSGRWKSLNRAYKNTKDNNRRSGSGRKSFEYESQFDAIFQNDPSITPEAILSIAETPDDSNSTESTNPPKKQRRKNSDTPSVATTMQNFIREQERYRREESERKERMHKEKLETLKSLIDVFTHKKRNEGNDSDN